ncbi:hypothetical protein [Streptomyces virginiae]|uniref:hypothetical protein n=1 Tax=Streptomyces virginiae TaxID=1961 RepID=UPI0036389601
MGRALAGENAVSGDWVQWMVNGKYADSCLDDSANYDLRVHTCSSASFSNGYQKRYLFGDPGIYMWTNEATGNCIDFSASCGLRLHACSVASFEAGLQAWRR